MLTGKEIFNNGIVTNALTENIQQVGVDLRVKKICKVSNDTAGIIPVVGRTTIPTTYIEATCAADNPNMYKLEPGYYEVTFIEGCKVPYNAAVKPMTRSSLVRCGVQAYSGVFDPGFTTENLGCFISVSQDVYIERGARLVQLVAFSCNDVDNPYNGQFQNDSQRDK